MNALEARPSDLDSTLLARARLLMGRIEEGLPAEAGARLALRSAIQRARASTRLRSGDRLRRLELERERAERMAELLAPAELAELERHGLGQAIAIHTRRSRLHLDDETGALIGAGLLLLIALTAILAQGSEGGRMTIAGLLLAAVGLFAHLVARALGGGHRPGKVVVCDRGLVVLGRGGSLACPWGEVACVRQVARRRGERSHLLEVLRHDGPPLRFGPDLPTVTTLAAQVLRARGENDPRGAAETLAGPPR